MEATERRDPLVTGIEVEVEGVAEHDVVSKLRNLSRQQPTDARFRRQRNEGRRADLAMGGTQRASARERTGVGSENLKR